MSFLRDEKDVKQFKALIDKLNQHAILNSFLDANKKSSSRFDKSAKISIKVESQGFIYDQFIEGPVGNIEFLIKEISVK